MHYCCCCYCCSCPCTATTSCIIPTCHRPFIGQGKGGGGATAAADGKRGSGRRSANAASSSGADSLLQADFFASYAADAGVSSFPGPAAVSTDVLLSGMRQAEQQAVLSGFRAGEFQVLLATCIGEEGLDIPQVGCSSGSFLAQQWQFPCTASASAVD